MAMRLLIVDDSSMIRSRIARIVGGGRLSDVAIVGLARNGAEALRLALAHRPDVVTIDLTMPEMDGLECIPRLLAAMPEVHILVVSALSDKSTAIQALLLGARGFLDKPFSDDQLLLALLDVTEARHAA
jgi:two-component system chemotaxis response regulator CheY